MDEIESIVAKTGYAIEKINAAIKSVDTNFR